MTTTATCNTPNTMKIKYTLYTVYSNYRHTYKLIFDYANVSLEIPQYLCYSLQGLAFLTLRLFRAASAPIIVCTIVIHFYFLYIMG